MTPRWLSGFAICVLLAGCAQASSWDDGGKGFRDSGGAPPPSSAGTSAGAVAASPTGEPTKTIQAAVLYFTAAGQLSVVPSQVSSAAPARQALEQLFNGPPDAGHSTEIPDAARLQDIVISARTARVSLNEPFFAPGGATGTLLRLAQVVYTVTQFPGVTDVIFLRDGGSVDLIGEGFPLNRPLTRQDFPSMEA